MELIPPLFFVSAISQYSSNRTFSSVTQIRLLKNNFTEFNRTRNFQSFTLKMITDIHGAEHDKRQRKTFLMILPYFLRNVVARK